MRSFLDALGAVTSRWPRGVIGTLVAVTVVLGAVVATFQEMEVDLTQFGREDSEAVRAMERVRDEFGDPTAAVQVVLDAGRDGDVLTADGMAALGAAEVLTVEALGPDVRRDADGRPVFLSLRSSMGPAIAEVEDPGTPPDAEIGEAASRAIGANPHLAAMISDDVDVDEGRARASVLVALLDRTLHEDERTDAALRVRSAFEQERASPLHDVEVLVFSTGLFYSELLDEVRSEVPRLFALALLVVLFILALTYRDAFDVIVGAAGLVMTVVWTFGLVALLGPSVLGWTGPLSQLAVLIPVLLVGLGVDYSVHLTARYREQRADGQDPSAAAARSLRTVGTALVLATAATAIGFGSIVVAPLEMLADLGVFVAVGVICAFVVMGLLVPAARVWRDGGRTAHQPDTVRELHLGPLMKAPRWLALRAPAAGLAAAGLLTAASLVAAASLETEFDRDDFIPEGSAVELLLAQQEELFGGGLDESTFVVIDGDLTDPTLANAVLTAQRAVGELDGVRTINGQPHTTSAASLAATILDVGGAEPGVVDPDRSEQVDPAVREAWDGDGFVADADLAEVYALLRREFGDERVEQFLADDARSGVVQIRTTGGDDEAARLRHQIEAAFAPVDEMGGDITVTSDPIIMTEMSDDLGRFQARAVALTLAVVLVLLTAHYLLTRRRWLLGPIAMIPAVVSASAVLGTMWLLGISFNVVTATLTAIAVGIGVPYGVHVVNRFLEALDTETVSAALGSTLRGTGVALAGSALTTFGAFVVLAFSGLPPMRSLGVLGGVGILVALLASLLVEPGALVLWARQRRDEPGTG